MMSLAQPSATPPKSQSSAPAQMRQLLPGRCFPPEIDAAMNECLTVQADCRRALLRHIYAVGAEMSPEDGPRYVKMMTARIVEPGLSHETVISQSPK
jgi:hypothetical protein